MDEIIKDSRFSHVYNDAKFRKLPKNHTKVKIDKRFQSMFNDKKFNVKCNVDKRGRSVNVNCSDDLKRYYDMSESESDDNEKKGQVSITSNTENNVLKQNRQKNQLIVSKNEKEKLTSEVKKKLKDMNTDYARGEGTIFSESSSDEETTDEEVIDEKEFEHCWGELDKDAERTDEITSRLAVCNLDWDRIGAVDLMVLFHSFLPKGGLIHSIIIYPSEYGLQRMKEEEEKGPIELVEGTREGGKEEKQEEEEEEESSQVQMEKIRKYQINRLRYYYAVVECDSPETADTIYKECDGLDYECSNSKLDLRFISDDTTFEQAPKDICRAMPDVSTYKPKYFVTSALSNAKVDLTWDETDVNRQDIVKSIHSGQYDENCLKKYLACSSSEEEEEKDDDDDDDDDEEYNRGKVKTDLNENGVKHSGEQKLNYIQKYKALLVDVQNSENNKKNSINMEVTWNLDLEKKANELVKKAESEKTLTTPFQQYLNKRKEKKKKKKLERLLQSAEGTEACSDNAFSDDEIPSDIDLNDPYFREERDAFKEKSGKSKKKKKPDKIDVESGENQFKKAELELLMLDQESGTKHFNLKDIETSEAKKLKKGKKRKACVEDAFSDNFQIDVNDERFSGLYTSSFYNIDPADPAFRPTKGTKELIAEKLRRRENEEKKIMRRLKEKSREKEEEKSDISFLVGSVKKKLAQKKKV